MNVDEIVKMFRDESIVLYGGGRMLSQDKVREAADLIESLRAQLTEKDLEMEVLEGRAENQREYLMSLRRQLIASQRETKAAVEDLTLVASGDKRECPECLICVHKGKCAVKPYEPNCFEWRGPQEAGEETK